MALLIYVTYSKLYLLQKPLEKVKELDVFTIKINVNCLE